MPPRPRSIRAWSMASTASLGLCALFAAADTHGQVAGFPRAERPVADIVSASWGDKHTRDEAHEADQIVERLGLRPGMTVADIGAGDGYDTLALAPRLGPEGLVIAEDVTPSYLKALATRAARLPAGRVRVVQGAPQDPHLAPHSIDAAIMVHMYHEITSPYALLYNLAPAFRPGGRIGVEELDRPTATHGTPPALLTCEFEAVGYRRLSLAPLTGGIGYFAVFTAPAPDARPRPADIKPCRG